MEHLASGCPCSLQGTSTSLHSDVLRSFSWSANVVGCKLWRLLPPQVGLP